MLEKHLADGEYKFSLEQLWWANELDGQVFVGLGEKTQKVSKGMYRFTVLPEWCIDGEAELI